MADHPTHDLPPRRRSSIAYDPARDTFKEIPDNNSVASGVIEDDRISSPMQQPKLLSARKHTPEESRKRSHDAVDNQPLDPMHTENAYKKVRPSSSSSSHAVQETDLRAAQENTGTESKSPSDARRLSRIPKRESSDRPRASHDIYGRREYREPTGRRRSRSSDRRHNHSAYSRRPSPPRRRDPAPRRSPSPIRNDDIAPVQRPGGGRGPRRNVLAEQQRLAAEREAKQTGPVQNVNRGVQDVSNQFYNARPEWVKERGREWRRNESQIKGLRSFNNWIKSCLIQKFSPEEKSIGEEEELGWGEEAKEPAEKKPLLVLDIGCGKGGDLGKWEKAPQQVGLYVGLDPASMSVTQAIDRYKQMRNDRRRRTPIFDAKFQTKDCYGEWIGEVPIVNEVGIDPNAGSGQISRWSRGGFDVVTIMFAMHYAFESEEKVRMMLRNVAGSLKKGGRFIGVVPNSDVLAEHIREWYKKQGASSSHNAAKTSTDSNAEDVLNGAATQPNGMSAADNEQAREAGSTTPAPADSVTSTTVKPTDKDRLHDTGSGAADDDDDNDHNKRNSNEKDNDNEPTLSWGNSIYRVSFPPPSTQPGTMAHDGSFRPPFGWKYTYWMAEAVDVPEFIVPWEAFRSIAEAYGLEQRFRKGFLDMWDSETAMTGGADGPARELRRLAVRMGVVREEGGPLLMTEEEKEAVGFYHGFCFVKT